MLRGIIANDPRSPRPEKHGNPRNKPRRLAAALATSLTSSHALVQLLALEGLLPSSSAPRAHSQRRHAAASPRLPPRMCAEPEPVDVDFAYLAMG